MEELKKMGEILGKLTDDYDNAQCEIMDEIEPLENKKELYSKIWDHATYALNHINSLMVLIEKVDSLGETENDK